MENPNNPLWADLPLEAAPIVIVFKNGNEGYRVDASTAAKISQADLVEVMKANLLLSNSNS